MISIRVYTPVGTFQSVPGEADVKTAAEAIKKEVLVSAVYLELDMTDGVLLLPAAVIAQSVFMVIDESKSRLEQERLSGTEP
jgi:hypothetical protein